MLYVYDGPPHLDPCSNDFSIMGAEVEYKLPKNDGLQDTWTIKPQTNVWLNPPFGRSYMKPERSDIVGAKQFKKLKDADKANGTKIAEEYSVHTSIGDWIKRAASEEEHVGHNVTSIIPAAADTDVWQSTVFKTCTSILWIKGRVRFLMTDGKPGGPCPMAMALVLWGTDPMQARFHEAFSSKGTITDYKY